MDAFYASVEQHDNPELRGKPVLVGGSPRSRGVVAAASYEAREFGCRSAMPMRTAVRLCPHAEIVSPRFPRYGEVSRQVMAIFRRATPIIEPLSLDEAFLDVTQRTESGSTPEAIARWIKGTVRAETGLTVSCGVATTKSVAKIASDRDKPDGLTVVLPGSEAAFLAPLPIGDLWGVGPKTAQRLRAADVHTVQDLAQRPLAWLIDRFGVRGAWFHRLARGEDDRAVETNREAKSVSSETTFAEDVGDYDELEAVVRRLSGGVARRLQRGRLQGKTVQIKMRLSDFTTFTRQRTLPLYTDDASEIEAAAAQLLRDHWKPAHRYRLVGVGISSLEQGQVSSQLFLFERASPGADDSEELEATVDSLREQYGEDVIRWHGDEQADDERRS